MKKVTICTLVICLLITITLIITMNVIKLDSDSGEITSVTKALSLSSRDMFNSNLTLSSIEKVEVLENDEQKNEIIKKADNIINKLNLDNTMDLNLEKTEITKEYDTLKKYGYYKVNKGNYIINVKDDDNMLCGIYNNNYNYNIKEKGTIEEAREFIINKYSELNLPEKYVLDYLGEFDDVLWEADFCEMYDGIPNPYASVKIFFSPVTKEISALTVFNESYKGDSKTQINEDTAIDNLLKSRTYLGK